jgi:hypothetical protein
MRYANLPDFKKLWGKISNVKQGYYMIQVNNQWDVKGFGGKKYLYMSTTNSFGGKNYFLAACFISVGSFSVFAVILFTIVHFKNMKNPPDYLLK